MLPLPILCNRICSLKVLDFILYVLIFKINMICVTSDCAHTLYCFNINSIYFCFIIIYVFYQKSK